MPMLNTAKPLSNPLANWAAVLLWAGLIFYLSSMPKLGLRTDTLLVPKLAHVIEYAFLTFLLVRALEGHRSTRRRAAWIGAAIALVYAVTDEFHQGYVPNRHSSALDVLIDGIGIGTVAWWRS
jgi:VanZ family protein